MERENIQKWYDCNKARYADLVETLERLIKTLLAADGIPYHSVNGRVKDKESCAKKFDRKAYETPEQMMDLAGLRIITHTTAEVDLVCRLIEREFAVDPENSGDKAKDMGVDKVGYLSVHYIVKIDPTRLALPEYSRFKGLCCEIQIRSLLQHAWAEIEHDRSYKFAGVLPENIQRKFYLIAGTLELMDQEFCTLANEIDQYAEHVKIQTEQGEFENISIDSTSLQQFLNDFFKECDPEILSKHFGDQSSVIIEELSDFGTTNLQQVSDLLNQREAREWIPSAGTSFFGILRDAMILKDPKKYFEDAWKQRWRSMTVSDLDAWKSLGIDTKELEKYIQLTPGTVGELFVDPAA